MYFYILFIWIRKKIYLKNCSCSCRYRRSSWLYKNKYIILMSRFNTGRSPKNKSIKKGIYIYISIKERKLLGPHPMTNTIWIKSIYCNKKTSREFIHFAFESIVDILIVSAVRRWVDNFTLRRINKLKNSFRIEGKTTIINNLYTRSWKGVIFKSTPFYNI